MLANIHCIPCIITLLLLQQKRELKSRKSLSGLANAFHSVLSSSSVHQPENDFYRQEEVASCSGNWLSHLDWEGERCAPFGHFSR